MGRSMMGGRYVVGAIKGTDKVGSRASRAPL